MLLNRFNPLGQSRMLLQLGQQLLLAWSETFPERTAQPQQILHRFRYFFQTSSNSVKYFAVELLLVVLCAYLLNSPLILFFICTAWATTRCGSGQQPPQLPQLRRRT